MAKPMYEYMSDSQVTMFALATLIRNKDLKEELLKRVRECRGHIPLHVREKIHKEKGLKQWEKFDLM